MRSALCTMHLNSKVGGTKMIPEIKNDDAKNLFQKLADIEINHQDRIYEEYLKVAQESVTRSV